MIGKKSGLVVSYDVRSKGCRVCDATRENETIPDHDCPRNWNRSSKGMEPDMAVAMAHNLAEEGFRIDVVHADQDSTTAARLKVDFPNLEKKDDQNHLKKSISKSLYELSKRFEMKKLSRIVIICTLGIL